MLVPFYLNKLENLNNFFNVLFPFVIIFLFENLIKSKKTKKLFVPIIFCVFYTNILHDSIIFIMGDFTLNDQIFSSMWRYHYSLTLLFFISIILSFIKEKIIKSLLIIFSFSTMFFGMTQSTDNQESTLLTKQSIPSKKNSNSIILIILDEYASPFELSNYLDEVDMYSFSNYLTKNKWLVKNNFFSNETSTTLSVYSLLHFY